MIIPSPASQTIILALESVQLDLTALQPLNMTVFTPWALAAINRFPPNSIGWSCYILIFSD